MKKKASITLTSALKHFRITATGIMLSLGATTQVTAEIPPETYGVLTLESMPEHGLLVNTFSGSTLLFNADTAQVLGTVSTGIGANAYEIDRDAGVIHTAETYLSRHTRGTRTDVISTYDLRTLSPKNEIVIPPKHASGSPQRHYTGILQDNNNQFMLVTNITPAVSISVVDLAKGKFKNEVFTAGCGLIYPLPSLQFLQLCGDGTAQLIGLDSNGNETHRTRSAAFFSLDDPLSEKGVKTKTGWLFTTFSGKVFEITVTGDNIKAEHQFDIADDASGWRMGGMQPLALHKNLGVLLALVHEGGEDTHKDQGSQVWYYSMADGRRIHQLILAHETSAIEVSQDDNALLYAGSIMQGLVDIYDLKTARRTGTLDNIELPALLQGL